MNMYSYLRSKQQVRSVFAGFAIAALIISAIPYQASAISAPVSPYGTDEITNVRICHAAGGSGTYTNPTVSINATGEPTGHGDHSNDIIPPYYYDGGINSGNNWDTLIGDYTGQEIWNNDCVTPSASTPITGSISGTKYEDTDNDGSIDGESPSEGWTIRLYEVDTPWELVETTTTDSNGEYSFTDLPEGEYKVCEVMQDGWEQTYVQYPAATNKSPNVSEEGEKCRTVNIDTDGESNTVNFGNYFAEPAVVDVCPNIEGDQSEIPQGYVINNSGDCVPEDVTPVRCENLLTNGSFEEPEVTNNPLWQKFASVAGWVIEKVGDDSATTLEIHRDWSSNEAAEGEQYAELDGDHSTKVSQTIATIPGAEYELKWAFAPRHNIAAEQNQLSVLLNGAEVATNGPATGAADLEPGDWTLTSYPFTATEENTTITFSDAGPSNSFGTFLDDAQLCLVREPEPEVTIEVTKIVCDDESLLPNDGYSKIDADTADEFFASLADEDRHKCRLATADEFAFQWALGGVKTEAAPDNAGELDAPWEPSVPTNEAGVASIMVNADTLGNADTISVREVVDTENYLPFTGKSNEEDVSAELYCHTDAGNFDNLDWVKQVTTDTTYHCVAWNVPIEKESDVTLCKYDEEQNPLSGWTLMMTGEQVDTLEVPAGTPTGVDSVALTGGQSYVALANGTWDNNRGPLNIVDAEYSTEDNWLTWMDGFDGFTTDILELFIGGQSDPASEWGTYNSNHRYAQSFVPGVDGPVTFNINDTNYADNTGSLNVDVYTGYAGITEDNGCVTFEDVPYGTYDVDEIMLDGWQNVSGLGEMVVDSESVDRAIVNRDVSEIPVATLVAEKVVCEAEEYLPNWNDEGTAPNITGTTAADYVALSEGACWLEEDWEFEWASQNASNPDSDVEAAPLYGVAGAGWTTFGPTDGSGKATVSLTEEQIDGDSHIWVREVLQDGHIPFTYGPSNKTNQDNVTAEFYCHTDGQNYDNYDKVSGIAVEETYHCVAFNTEIEKPVEQCTLNAYSDIGTVVFETNQYAVETYEHNNWTAAITSAEWIWNTEYVEEPVDGEMFTFVETFTVENPTAATLDIAADNWYKVYINDELVVDRAGQNSYQAFQQKQFTTEIMAELISGENEMKIEVFNDPQSGGSRLSNPAGLLYALEVTGDARCAITTEPEPEAESLIIDGYKYDTSGDGEPVPYKGWNIYVENSDAVITLATTTDENGYYWFEVEAGEWEVTEEVLLDWEQINVVQNGIPVEVGGGVEYCTFNVSEETADEGYQCDFYNAEEDDDLQIVTRNSNVTGTRIAGRSANAPGEVLGITDSLTCGLFLEDYMRMGQVNNRVQVLKLQAFLMGYMGYDVTMTGDFDAATDAAVRAFQAEYQDEILTPWLEIGLVPHDNPTGYVYQLTRWKINNLMCPGSEPYPAELR